MSTPFDPYHKWLGIPPEHRPPDHYRLLAIPQFTSDPDVIEHAADQRMAHLRTMQIGPHSESAQQLLNQVAAAKACLLNSSRRATYDADLKKEFKTDVGTPPEPPVEPPPVATAFDLRISERSGESNVGAVGRVNSTRQRRSLTTRFAIHFFASAGGLVLGYLFVVWVRPDADFLRLFSKRQQEPSLSQSGKRETITATPQADDDPSESRSTNGPPPAAPPESANPSVNPIEPAPAPTIDGPSIAERRQVSQNKRDAAVRSGNFVEALQAVEALATLDGVDTTTAKVIFLQAQSPDSPQAERAVVVELIQLLEKAVVEKPSAVTTEHIELLLRRVRSLNDRSLERRATLIAVRRTEKPD